MAARPYKCHYLDHRGRLVARVAACGSPDEVIRSACVRVLHGAAAQVEVYVDEELIGWIDRDRNGQITFRLPRR